MPIFFRRPGFVCADHFLDVPLDHAEPSGPSGPSIQVYGREVVAPGKSCARSTPRSDRSARS
ncbi:hypothetical protein [Actinomadura rubrisoli]|uniref:Uncharacterized protein n=1 Tax=Actinomadura rubrisoli TaxID=2530368 RepID=A0A4R5B5Y4_9ACTN|nr:hypothetical protein [Actinomadura rubrisoli]TDD80705.1 hypothetical protein E1298_25360 [Actinomadura rubrisoli]